MNLIRSILGLFFKSTIKPGATVSLVLGSGYSADKPSQRNPATKLSENYTLGDLTVTSNASLQDANRLLSDSQVQKLGLLARHAENISVICGKKANVHSGYRSDALNGATTGSSKTSQHPRCEAIDIDIPGQAIEETFTKLRAEAAAGRFRFGQLIIEQADRGYAVVKWVHCSTVGTLDPAKVGQVLKMTAGADGKLHYELLEQMEFPALTASV